MSATRGKIGFLVAALCTLGCGNGTSSVSNYCPAVASTGGDPTGTWDIMDFCEVPYARTTTDDWCSRLVWDDTAVHDGLFLGQEDLPIKQGSIKYAPDPAYVADPNAPNAKDCGKDCGIYEATFVYEGKTTTHFPPGCLKLHMADPTCGALGTQIQTLADSVLPTIQNVMCEDEKDGSGGCACSYLVTTMTLTVENGRWRVKDGLLVHYPGLLAQAGLTDMSIVGDTMLLHGHNGQPLLTHDPLRSLTLLRRKTPPAP